MNQYKSNKWKKQKIIRKIKKHLLKRCLYVLPINLIEVNYYIKEHRFANIRISKSKFPLY